MIISVKAGYPYQVMTTNQEQPMLLRLITFLIICLAILPTQGSLINEMTLEEKVGQLLMVHFNGEVANEEAKTLIQQAYVGSIIYYNWANSLHSPEQVRNLSNSLQALASQNRIAFPLLIAVDQEGGAVARLRKGFTEFPGNAALGKSQNPKLAERCAFAIGRELQAVGVNLNLAPVVDVNSNPLNSIIGTRAFGDSPATVTRFAKSTLKGYRAAGMITALKHFPGHGGVETDSHQDLPVIKKNREELDQTELFPFCQLCEQADTIVTAHLLVHALDPVNCTTLSKSSLDLLRTEIGFKGVIISDSLVMEGLLKNCHSIEDAAIRALNAGCDILLLGGKLLDGSHKNLELNANDCLKIHRELLSAIQDGRITLQRLNEAVQRILYLKNRYLSRPSNFVSDPLERHVATEEHRLLADEIATHIYPTLNSTD